MNILQTFC